jgi:hypothetical protein
VQVVVCAVLLVCGALLYRRASLFELQKTGMTEQGVIKLATGDHGVELGRELRTWPEVEAVAVAHRAPWFGRLRETAVIPSGQPNSQITGYNLVSPAYFRVFDIGLKSGRLFTEDEARAEAPVAIISQATAQAFWPGEDPIGKTLQTVESAERHLENLPNFREVRIVGVVADVMQGWLFEGRDRSCIYLPAAEANPKTAAQMLVLFHGNESTGLYRLRRWIADRWPTFEAETMPMSTILSLQIYPFHAAAWLGWMLGLVAMALSVSGMYGVMSYLVNQRSKEIGIRVALGATPSGVLAMVMRRSISLAGWGVLIGVAVAAGIVVERQPWCVRLG